MVASQALQRQVPKFRVTCCECTVAAQDKLNAEASLFPTHDTSKIGWHMRGLEAFAKNVEAVCYLLSSEMDMCLSPLGCTLVLSKPWNFSLSFCEYCYDALRTRCLGSGSRVQQTGRCF